MSELTERTAEQFERRYIDTGPALQQAALELMSGDAIGVDIEMGQHLMRRPGGAQEWKHVLSLIQIAGDGLSIVVDALRCDNLAPLRPLLGGQVRKVFLGGGQDAALLEEAGIPARRIADVGEVAYAVFGRREDGMAALSKRIFGINLDKTVRRTDWLIRPLNPSLIAYAHLDAELTLLIYRWFQQQYPVELSLHERLELEPRVPPDVPDWLRDAILRGSSDAMIIVTEHSLDATRDADMLAEDIRRVMPHFVNAPRRINRLMRIAGDLKLTSLLEEVLPLADSPSSLLRASAARAVGKMGDSEEGRSILARLAEDPIEDVRKAVESAQRDLKASKKRASAEAAQVEETEETGLGADAMAALRRLMQQMGGESDASPG